MSDALSKDYVLELLKCALSSNKVMEICARHLKYELLQSEEQKRIFKHMMNVWSISNQSPTLGMLGQAFASNQAVIGVLAKMKKINVQGREDIILGAFESFIKDIRFQAVLYKVAELHNAGKEAEAVATLAKESQLIQEFNIKQKFYVKVFDQYQERMTKRGLDAVNDEHNKKRERGVTGVHEMDQVTGGGYRRGTSFLCMARSGIGKTTYLRWCALANARLGKRVVFFQGESTQDEALEGFDAAWTSISGHDVEVGYVPDHLETAIEKVRREIIARGGEIILIAAEQFDQMTVEECREKLLDIIKREGDVDMVLFDYLEIFSTKSKYGTAESAERKRREDIANKMTNIATELNIVVGTATQSADIKPELLEKADFVMTRTHASEFKNVVKPFSYFFSLNATSEEYKAEILRIHIDKMRKAPGGQTMKIYQSRGNGRFYDAVKTKQTFYKDNYQ